MERVLAQIAANPFYSTFAPFCSPSILHHFVSIRVGCVGTGIIRNERHDHKNKRKI